MSLFIIMNAFSSPDKFHRKKNWGTQNRSGQSTYIKSQKDKKQKIVEKQVRQKLNHRNLITNRNGLI